MKKKLFMFLTLFVFAFSLNLKAEETEEILYEYNTTNPIYYNQTNDPVMLPTTYQASIQQFRGVWVCTIYNLDMPMQNGTTTRAIENYQNYYLEVLDTLESYNMNAIIFQVRPKNDAMYPSNLNPWSRFLTGVEGQNPGWDPLAWMIEETHKRGIEFHAWFNPYRVFKDPTGLDSKNFAYKHPEYVLYDYEILNPGEPAVQNFIVDTVLEVANNYDIDGVHFDDYFYPYGGLPASVDSSEFNAYNPLNLSLDEWRRENVNTVIKNVKSGLTEINSNQGKSIQFGVSPFGVWANRSSHYNGSNTSTLESYSELYADSYKWVKNEWVDYIVPQVYWEFTQSNASYHDVVDWWATLVKDTNVNLYIGQSIYRYKEDGYLRGPWADPDELGNQYLYNSKYEEVKGTIQFRYQYLKDTSNTNLTYAQNKLKTLYHEISVLPPASKNVDDNPPSAPFNLQIENNRLSWFKDNQTKAYYIYRFNEGETIDLNDSSHLLDIVWPNTDVTLTYTDTLANSQLNYQYYVTAFDNANNQSNPTGIDSEGNLLTQNESTLEEIEARVNDANNLLNTIRDTNVEGELLKVQNAYTALNHKLSELNSELETINTEHVQIQSKYTELETSLLEYEQFIQTITTELSRIKNDDNKNSNDIENLDDQMTNLMSRHTNLETALNELKGQMDNLEYIDTTPLNELKDQFNNLYDSFDLMYKSFLNDIQVLNILSNTLIYDKSTLTSVDQNTIDLINTYLTDYNHTMTQVNELKSEIDTLKTNKTSIEADLLIFTNSESDLRNRLNQLKTESEEIKIEDETITQLNQEIYSLQVGIAEDLDDEELEATADQISPITVIILSTLFIGFIIIYKVVK